jgi:CBS domain containing-hemolysin-like protein
MLPASLLAFALLLVVLNAFFVLAEFAIVKVRTTRIEELVRGGSITARWTKHVIDRLDAHLSATQLGITLASLGLGWLGEPALAQLIEPRLAAAGVLAPVMAHTVSVTMAFLGITFLHVVFGELAPKSIAIRKAEKSALIAAGPLRAFYYLFFPFIWIFKNSAFLVLKILGVAPAGGDVAHTEEELRMILSHSIEQGELGHLRSDLIENLLDFSRLTTRQIMVPRTDVTYLSMDATLEENLKEARETGHTRFPVCRGGLDEVVGIVHIKDIFSASARGLADLSEIMREVLYVPDTMPVDRLLRTFQRRRMHLAVVVDEYGGASGIVTLEDVIEEIVGEVQDEFDLEPPSVTKTGSGNLAIEGKARLEDVLERLDVTLEEPPDVDTIGGYVQAMLGRLPRAGDSVRLGGFELRVQDARRGRVGRLEARRLGEPGVSAPAAGGLSVAAEPSSGVKPENEP